jgi:hypothetical protein
MVRSNPSKNRAYYWEIWIELELVGFLGPWPWPSHAVRAAIAKMANNTGLMIFIGNSHSGVIMRLPKMQVE